MQLAGRKAIITGASQGFGLAVAAAFLKQGAAVTLCARQSENLAAAVADLKKTFADSTIASVCADVSRPADVELLIQTAAQQMGGIDTIVSNAGIHGAKGPIDSVDWEEWSNAIDINLKGTVLVCKFALPYLKKNGYGKIILLSGGGATKPMPCLSAYAASKAAVVRFGETLAVEVKNFNIDVNSVAPGAMNTRLLEDVIAAGPDKIGDELFQQLLKQKAEGGAPLSKGADLCVYLASNASDGITGKLISAIWDPWETLSTYKQQLQNSDIFTLRRIIPSDRGETWD
jgi:NAD(P)-dependent dehydrogenase (short-subunit alcohol dehydrogenase family)